MPTRMFFVAITEITRRLFNVSIIIVFNNTLKNNLVIIVRNYNN